MGDRLGEQIGNYRLIRYLGRGGFAEVYLGEHIHIRTFAAIKMLRTQLTKDEVDKFRNEAYLLAHLEHPHIVRVFDFGLDGDTPFLIMDYAPNGTLRQRHPRGAQLPISTVIAYVKQLASALQYAHSQKLVHRDIKPENMLLGRNNEVLLSDFGIATVAQSSQVQNPQIIAGTATYMAPEQVQGKARPASDQYALGVVVYEWLTGRPPFQGSFAEIATQHISTSPPPLRWIIRSIPKEIEQVVMTSLQKDPDNRFTNIQAFANALDQSSRLSPPPVSRPLVGDHKGSPLPMQPIRSAQPTNTPGRPAAYPTPPVKQSTGPVIATGAGSAPASSGPVGSVPALPRTVVSTLWWPTFFLSPDDRKAISNGTLSQVRLDAPGTVLMSFPPPMPLPVVTTYTPPAKGSPGNIQYPSWTPATVYAGPSTQPTGAPVSSRSPIRTSRTPSSPPIVPAAQPATSSQQRIVRSTGSPRTSLPQPLPDRAAVRFAALSLISACLSIVSVVIAFILLNVNAVIAGESFDMLNALTNLAPAIIFTIAALGLIFGIVVIQKYKVFGKAKALAGSGIALAVLAAFLEVVRLASHIRI